MQIDVQYIHFKAKPQLEQFVLEKINKFQRLNEHITSCNAYLKLENSDTKENKVCEINVHIPGNNLFVKREAGTFEEAMSDAAHAMEEQLRSAKA